MMDLTGSARLEPAGRRPGLGVIAPFDLAIDDEYWRWAGDDAVLFMTRTPYVAEPVGVGLAEAVSDPAMITQAARSLSRAAPRATVYACTSGSFVAGARGERSLREAMAAGGLANPLTTSGALLDALAALGVRTVGVGTPYDRAVSARLGRFLQEAGYDTVSCAFLGLRGDIPRVSPASVHELAVAADAPSAQAVFLSCTNLRTFEVLEDLEERLGKPVLSANQVTMWGLLRAGNAKAAPVRQRLFTEA